MLKLLETTIYYNKYINYIIFVINKKTSNRESIISHCFPKLFYIDELNHATHTLTSYIIIIYIIHY